MKLSQWFLFMGFAITAILAGRFYSYNNGWIAALNDAQAVNEYHRQVDALKKDTPEARAKIWAGCRARAAQREGTWRAFGLWSKLTFRPDPVWKQASEPRRDGP